MSKPSREMQQFPGAQTGQQMFMRPHLGEFLMLPQRIGIKLAVPVILIVNVIYLALLIPCPAKHGRGFAMACLL